MTEEKKTKRVIPDFNILAMTVTKDEKGEYQIIKLGIDLETGKCKVLEIVYSGKEVAIMDYKARKLLFESIIIPLDNITKRR